MFVEKKKGYKSPHRLTQTEEEEEGREVGWMTLAALCLYPLRLNEGRNTGLHCTVG